VLGGGSLRRARERLPEGVELVGAHSVMHPSASLVSCDEACFVECSEVMADGWLRHLECLDEVAGEVAGGTRLALSCDQTEQTETGWVTQHADHVASR
jgi:hypothetical protein